jgi:hypothetical protein
MQHFEVENHGSILQFRALTPEAEAWVEEHIPEDAWFGGGFVCEPRFAVDIIDGMYEAGLANARASDVR